MRIYKIDDSSIEQVAEDNFSNMFRRQIQITVDDSVNSHAENVYVAVALTNQEALHLALLNLWSSEAVQMSQMIRDR